MRVGVLGIEKDAASNMLLNLRVRWPDMEVIWLRHADDETLIQSCDVILVGSATSSLAQQVSMVRDSCDTVVIAVAPQVDNQEELISVIDGGADDYLSLNTSAPLLVSRISAALRRVYPPEPITQWMQYGELRLNAATFEVFVGDDPIFLTPTEFQLLYHLMKNKGHLLTHQALQSMIWGSEGAFYTGSLRKYIQRLRSKLESSASSSSMNIVTVPRIGYRLQTIS